MDGIGGGMYCLRRDCSGFVLGEGEGVEGVDMDEDKGRVEG